MQPPSIGKKVFLSFGLIIASALYAFFQYTANPQQAPAVATPALTSEQNLPTNSSPSPNISPKPAGQYADGIYTGSPADAYYGTVQTEAIIKNGEIADVRFLQYPNDRNTSRRINSQAMPMLISEAVQAQSSNVDIVSGATFTSQAFQQSLDSALVQAKN